MSDSRKADESTAEQADPSRDRPTPAWHALEGPEVAETPEVGDLGLAAEEAAARQAAATCSTCSSALPRCCPRPGR
jgi:hypothetical protein